MLRHIALFTFADDVPDDEREGICADLRALPALVPQIAAYSVGLDAGIRDGNVDLAVVGDFEDAAAFAAYMEHPEHKRVGERITTAVRAVHRIQYER